MHIVIKPKDGGPAFTLCGERPSMDDIAAHTVMHCSREFLRHVGLCSTCVARYQYPREVFLPRDSGKAGRHV